MADADSLADLTVSDQNEDISADDADIEDDGTSLDG